MSENSSGGPTLGEQVEQLNDEVLDGTWAATTDADVVHDVCITSPETSREILIDVVRCRVSYRDVQSDQWGLMQQPVSDIETAIEQLIDVGETLPMHHVRNLGLDGHPTPPE